ncbi:ZP4 protein, partial [Atractosteus spatula]|nr:ZP4 protein [Atractosteus spatula]
MKHFLLPNFIGQVFAVEEAINILFTGIPLPSLLQDQRYTVKVVYIPNDGPRGEIVVSCPYRPYSPREGCKLPRSHQVACAPESISPANCLAKGCCVDPETSSCYYPLEECTADMHFVFAVLWTISVPPVDPASLVIAGNTSCSPVICTPELAIFKFPVTGCGTHAFVVGETTIYLAEVETLARRNSQSYGVITRDSPFSCPNPLDYGHTSTLHIHSKLPLPKHHRRFHIQTFQFLDSTSYYYINEEVYFMCSTELCLPSERQCVEGCFDGRKIPVLENPDAKRHCVRTSCPGKGEGPRD